MLSLDRFASGGTDMVLTGSVAVDLGGKYNCIPGVAGIINGFGVVGETAVCCCPNVSSATHHTCSLVGPLQMGAVLQGGLVSNTYYFAGRTGLAVC